MNTKKPAIKKVKEAITLSQGRVAEAARRLGVSHQSLYNWLNEDRDLREHLSDIREYELDKAESKLSEAVDRGDAWAIKFMLTCLGKSRGWRYNDIKMDPLEKVFAMMPKGMAEELKRLMREELYGEQPEKETGQHG